MKAAYLLFFALVLSAPLFAYIDPGTGSMLFSLLTGLAVTVFFFAKNLILKIKTGFSSKGNSNKAAKPGAGNGRQRLVIYSEGKQYWNVFKPIAEELDRRGGIEAAYYTSGEDDPGLSFQSAHIRPRFIGKGNEGYRFLNFLEADVCLMTTPSLDVFQLKRSPGVKHYAHIVHAVTDATSYRLFGLDYFDSVFLSGEYQKKDLRLLEALRGLKEKQLFVTGCTYLDVLAAGRMREASASEAAPEAAPGTRKTALVAPSWGANGILRKYGLKLLLPLATSPYHLIIRPHPQSMIAEAGEMEKLRAALAPYPNVEWNFDAENLTALSRADVLISDFSGVIFDYTFLFERPVVYARFEFDKRPYDMADIADEAWMFRAVRELGVPLDEGSFAGIEKTLDRVIADAGGRITGGAGSGANDGADSGVAGGTSLTNSGDSPAEGGASRADSGAADIRRRLKDEAWMFRGDAGKKAVDALETLLRETAGGADSGKQP